MKFCISAGVVGWGGQKSALDFEFPPRGIAKTYGALCCMSILVSCVVLVWEPHNITIEESVDMDFGTPTFGLIHAFERSDLENAVNKSVF